MSDKKGVSFGTERMPKALSFQISSYSMMCRLTMTRIPPVAHGGMLAIKGEKKLARKK